MIVQVRCGCGNEREIQVIFIPGLELLSECVECHTKFRLNNIHYSVDKPNTMDIGVDSVTPSIIVPH